MPDFVTAAQLKAEFLGRIANATIYNSENIKTSPRLVDLLLNKKVEGIESFFPGPLEGGIKFNRTTPPEVENLLKENLLTDSIEMESFNVLINSALMFDVKPEYTEITVRVLREAKYYVKQYDGKKTLYPLLSGLATVAAVSRSKGMADELHYLMRRAIRQPGQNFKIDQCLPITLMAAASRENLNEWCQFVGEWLTELAFEDLSIEEAKKILLEIKNLCRIVPELWPDLGRAEAALESFSAI